MNQFQPNSVMTKIEESRCVFLITQGRSGSTLLLRLINTIEGYNICGENLGAIGELYGFYKAILETKIKAPKNEDSSLKSYSELLAEPPRSKKYSGFEWYNVFQVEKIQSQLRELIFEMFNPNSEFEVWGFKEIRFGGKNKQYKYNRFQEELDFIKFLFPQAKFIFNTRKIEEIVKSGWWNKDPEAAANTLQKQADFFKRYSSENPDFTYSVTYHDIVNNTEILQGMYDFLGESFDLEKYKSVLERR